MKKTREGEPQTQSPKSFVQEGIMNVADPGHRCAFLVITKRQERKMTRATAVQPRVYILRSFLLVEMVFGLSINSYVQKSCNFWVMEV